MRPAFLVAETTTQDNGHGPALAVEPGSGIVQITLGITRSVEQESIEIAIVGSADGEAWGKLPLGSFPQKFYCGTYSIFIDLSSSPDVRWLRAEWKVNRWGRGSLKPLFGFYLFAEPAAIRAMSA